MKLYSKHELVEILVVASFITFFLIRFEFRGSIFGEVGRRREVDSQSVESNHIDELVVDHFAFTKLVGSDSLCNFAGFSERDWVTAGNISDSTNHVLSECSTQVSLSLATVGEERKFLVVCYEGIHQALALTVHESVNSAAKTLVRRNRHNQNLRVALDLIEHTLHTCRKFVSQLQGILMLSQLGCGNHIHRLGDLRNVLDCTQTVTKLLLRGEATGTGGFLHGSRNTRNSSPSKHLSLTWPR
mmetsp:Transcript_3757/g.6974  ORF Transcript_3757/g.6974 Transcript_3757/m.6974 type:complete len:243 (+) Transcript_3757:386-1114(+)